MAHGNNDVGDGEDHEDGDDDDDGCQGQKRVYLL